MVMDLPVTHFHKVVASDDLVAKNEKEVCDMVVNYIKVRKGLEDPNSQSQSNQAENKLEGEQDKAKVVIEKAADEPVQDEVVNPDFTDKAKNDAKKDEDSSQSKEDQNNAQPQVLNNDNM